MKKPVVRSPLEKMPLSQKQALIGWLTTGGANGVGIPYEEARARLAQEFGVKVSRSAIHGFYHRNHTITEPAPRISYDAPTRTLTIVIRLSE